MVNFFYLDKDPKNNLIDELSYIHLIETIKIGKQLNKQDKLNELNIKSLKFRNKL